jgi:hypothetical protein
MRNEQKLASHVKHPNIHITHQAPRQAPKHRHSPSSTPRHWHCPLSTQRLPSIIKHPRHWHCPFKHPNIENIILQAPARHPHLKTIFVGRYAQTSDQTQASIKQSHISSNSWTMPINLVYQPLSPMATSESTIYLLESRFSPLMKKGCAAKFCKQ